MSIPPFLYTAFVKVIPGLSQTERLIALDENRHYDRAEMINVLAKLVEVAQRYSVPLRCGEFGVIKFLAPEIGERSLQHTFSVFQELNVGWSYWCYGKGENAFGIIDEKGNERPVMSVIKEVL